MNVIGIISDIFIAAMAVFGLWCALQFLTLDLTSRSSLRCAVSISSPERIGDMCAIVYEIDRSALVAKEENYALLFDDKSLAELAEKEMPKEISGRVELYLRFSDEKFKEKE